MSLPYLQPYLGLSNGLNTLHAAGAGAVGGWVELGRNTLGGASSTIDVTSLADKRYYMVLHSVVGKNTVTVDDGIRLGNGSFDTGSNYARRRNVNGGTDTTATSQTSALLASSDTNPQFDISYMVNYSSKEKLGITHRVHQGGAGSGSIGNRQEFVWKWANTSNPIDRWQFWSGGSDTFNSGSEVVVLGWDPADTHTNNFWEELASVTASGSSTNLSSGTITAKKYLWVQCYIGDTSNGESRYTFNNDSGTNYSQRRSIDGAADTTITSLAYTTITGNTTTPHLFNMFIINNASNEKLIIGNLINQNTAGAGTAPQRIEFVSKWSNTSNQITEIDFDSEAGNYPSNCELRVWGAD
jgi:hypothetical protein